jgi:hypothetical protein
MNPLGNQLAIAWGVSTATVQRHSTLIDALISHSKGELPSEHHRALREALFYSDNAWLLAAHHHDERLGDPLPALLSFLETLHTGASRAESARINWVRSRTAGSDELDFLQASVEADPTFDLAGDDMLWRAAASGDRKALKQALSVWVNHVADPDLAAGTREPTPDEALRLGLQTMYAIAPVKAAASIGRNDLCPCESGKKYKACHLGKVLPGDDASTGVSDQEFTALSALYLLFIDRRYPQILVDLMSRTVHRLQPLQATMLCIFALDCEAAARNQVDDFVIALKLAGWKVTEPLESLMRSTMDVHLRAYEVVDRVAGVSLTIRDLATEAIWVSHGTESSRQFAVGDSFIARVIGPNGRTRLGQGALGLPLEKIDGTVNWLAGQRGQPTAREIVQRSLGGFEF